MIRPATNLLDRESQKIAENLNDLFKNRNANINQVAQALGIPVMTIRRLISGETADPRISTLKQVADYFNVTVDSLIENSNPTIISNSKKILPHFVPLIPWEVAEKIRSVEELDLSKWKEWQSVSLNINNIIGKNTFALESRPSMYPRFPQGTIFIIDPDTTPTDGDIVLVRIKEKNELTLRELMIDPPEWLLQPIINGSAALSYSESKYEITGVNLLTMLYNRKPG